MEQIYKQCQSCGKKRKLEDLIITTKDLSKMYRLQEGKFIISYAYCKDSAKCLKVAEKFNIIIIKKEGEK